MLGGDFALLNAYSQAPPATENKMLSPEELMRGLKPLEAMENKTQPLRCESHLAQADEAAAKIAAVVRGNKVRRRKKTEEELIFTKEELAPAPAAGKMPLAITTQLSTNSDLAEVALEETSDDPSMHKAQLLAEADNAADDPSLIALCESWLPPSVRLVAFDFDLTILKVHAYKEKVEPRDVEGRWIDDVADLPLLRVFVRTARSRGIHLAIASFGKRLVIQSYMEHILKGTPDEGYFKEGLGGNIATPASVGLREGSSRSGKARLLKLLRENADAVTADALSSSVQRAATSEDGGAAPPAMPLMPIQRSEVLFFDDHAANIQSCKGQGYPRCCHVPKAFTRQSLSEKDAYRIVVRPPPSFATVARLAAAFRVPAAKVADVRRAKEEQKVAAQGGSSRDLLGASVSTTTTSRRSSSERLSFVRVESERKSSLVPMSKEQMNFKIGMCLDHMPG